ncbi:MAG TPA: class I SAM-dependent methyltransferase [Candidatus Acidoferrales bacterium]|nr:class I SAM-dependent methyltransferase [Candidatus Acidoferrales bacterium]
MSARPEQWGPQHAAAFDDAEVARRYYARPPYAPAAMAFLRGLIDPSSYVVLDVGTGTGKIARELATTVERVDAVDVSAPMLEEGRRLAPRAPIRWIHARVEDAPLSGPYGLATAGSSLHWMDWDVVCPKIAGVLTSGAALAVVEVNDPLLGTPGPVLDAIIRHSAYEGKWQHIDLIAELTRRERFAPSGRRKFGEPFRQPVEEFIDALHSSSSLAPWRIGPERTRSFDEEIRRAAPRDADGLVTRDTVTEIVWGRPA